VKKQRCAVHELADGESVQFTLHTGALGVDNEKVKLTLERKSGRRARLRIEAGDGVSIERLDAAAKRPT
jgi:hypothetical protein